MQCFKGSLTGIIVGLKNSDGKIRSVVTYLQMCKKPSLIQVVPAAKNVEIKRVENIPIHFYRQLPIATIALLTWIRYLYNTVGGPVRRLVCDI
jgi:hypothetical protein